METTEILEHEALDTILKYLIDNKSDRPIHSSRICKETFPNLPEEEIYYLLKKIMATTDLVTSHSRSEQIHNFDVFFEANAITKNFLTHQGGFTRQYTTDLQAANEQAAIDKLNFQKLTSEVDIIKFQKGLGKKLTIWGFIVAVFSVIASILITVYGNPNKLEGSQIETLKIQITDLESRLKALELEKSYKQSNKK